MKAYFKNIQNLLIVVLVALLFLQRSCSSPDPVDPVTITEIVTKWDTVKVEKTKYVPKWRTKIIHDTIPTNVDTIGSIIVNDTVTKNLILSRNVQSNIFVPTITVNKTIYIYKKEFFGGISVGATNQAVQNINGELLYVNKKRDAYGFGIGLNPDFQPIYTVRMYWKIGK